MKLTIRDCAWPELSARYLGALKAAVAYVLENYPSTVGIIASGTVLRGCPDRSSDLDIYVIQSESFRQRVQLLFGGVPAEIFVNPPSMIEKYFQEEWAGRRPITAHMISTGFVVADIDPIVADVRTRAHEMLERTPPPMPDLTMHRYMIATLFEDAVDVYERDAPTHEMLLSNAVEQMLRYAFLKSRKYQPRAKDLLGSAGALDEGLGLAAHRFYAARSRRRRLRMANQIADWTIGSRGFFEWKSERDQVP